MNVFPQTDTINIYNLRVWKNIYNTIHNASQYNYIKSDNRKQPLSANCKHFLQAFPKLPLKLLAKSVHNDRLKKRG